MRLDQELVERGLCLSRTEAQELIKEGCVLLNHVVCKKQTRLVTPVDEITVTSQRRYVSRGGGKLQGVLEDVFGSTENIQASVEGKTILDIGSSTGGFTDCLLQYGAKHIDCVDVGSDQLHNKIRANPQISVFENTDIRSFVSSTSYNSIVADVSFISLTSIFDDILKHGSAGTHYFLLIKPQFEVGKGNTKKGIVKDEALVAQVLSQYKVLAEEKGLGYVEVFPCHIQGGDGNQEYFLHGILK